MGVAIIATCGLIGVVVGYVGMTLILRRIWK